MIEIINEQVYLRYGDGSIAMQSCTTNVCEGMPGEYKLGAIALTSQEPQEIGKGSQVIYKTYEELKDKGHAFLTFKNTKSIDILIQQLEEVKDMMNGEKKDV